METLDLSLRAATAATMLVLIWLFLRDLRQSYTGPLGALFLFSCISYLYCGRLFDAWNWGTLEFVFFGGCASVPAFFWLFVNALFRDDFRLRYWHGGMVLLFVALLFGPGLFDANIEQALQAGNARSAFFILRQLLALGLIVHALLVAGLGRAGDLVESRRRFRSVFIGVVGAYIGTVLVVEVFFIQSAVPPALETLNAAAIFAVTFFLTIAVLRLPLTLLAGAPIFSVTEQQQPALSSADQITVEALTQHMEKDRGYRQEGLTISVLAGHLGIPEHRLRRLINGELGFRNFAEFLNSYRIREACESLSDPAKEHLPVLTIALDTGYRSIGPFNRAFKAKLGMTPSNYRRANMAHQTAESST